MKSCVFASSRTGAHIVPAWRLSRRTAEQRGIGLHGSFDGDRIIVVTAAHRPRLHTAREPGLCSSPLA